MFIRKIQPNVFDVFVGLGWDNWSRVRTSKSGPFVVAGNKLPYATLRELHPLLKPSAPTSFETEENHEAV
jgi:hypothetical protein